MRAWQAAVKRLMDLALGGIALIVVLPVALVIALAVTLDSAGPVIYGARRVGRGGREFTMFKFRTMARGADAVGPGVTGAHDFRITRVGAFLRRTKLDELPQLLNVLAGQMALVGPRPEAPQYVALWTDDEHDVLRVRPGVTGPTQVAYIDEEEMLATADPDAAYESELIHVKLAIDLEYVRHYALRRDVAILWRTVASIVSASERRSNRPRRRYTLGERLRSASAGALVLDAALAALAAGVAVGLRIDRNNILAAIATYWIFIPMAALVRPVGFLLAGAYLRVWRYPTISDVALVVSSLAAGSVVMALGIFVVLQPWAFPGTVGFPRSAILIELLISVLVLGGIRIASRVRQEELDVTPSAVAGPPRPVLIYGAGDAGAGLAREMLRNRALRLEPVAFVDDDASKHGQRIYGVEVAGGGGDLPAIVLDREVSEVIVAMPRVSGDELRRIVALCETAEVPVRTLPATQELLDSTVTVSKIRPVRLEDLLRREPADIPEEPIRQLIGGRSVLVSGAGGSIGSEVCRQVASMGARTLVLLEQAETPLFWIDDELRRRFPAVQVVPVMGDVTDARQVDQLLARHQPDVVIHAAAHKHVPMSEHNVAQTVHTNVRGTRIMVEAAARHGIATFVYVSTDKAVDAASVMGATKRMGERLVREIASEAPGRFVIVRFGNVLGSQGSVVELFARQIEAGGPVTVTHPDMTRFFMTIPEAVRLILLAAAVGRSGDVHILNMGQPIRISDLAHDLIRLTVPPGQEVAIEYTGLRPGERLEEILFAANEKPESTDYDSLTVARNGAVVRGAVDEACRLEAMADELDDEALRHALLAERDA
ncbi:MAG TPA: SDR family NAD(P)-dependent oxidoreductase [Candidatus Limnocylindria bacterium]|jgi:FlaA1/EpsC-like NDP-sugar epimerase/lipopolysaccharide/colanic/teichoic acid biosynthesis glycosyltransferase